MSTYWYLECTEHDPPIRSVDEVEQHTYGMAAIRELVKTRPVDPEVAPEEYFARHAWQFLRQHPKCALRFVSEYGEMQAIS